GRAEGPGRGRLRHGVVRSLVARGSTVAGGRAARVAGGRRAGDDVAWCGRGRPRVRSGGAARVVVGLGQGLASVGRRAGRRHGGVERGAAAATVVVGGAARVPRSGGRSGGAGGPAGAVERLGLHGHEGLGGRLRAPAGAGTHRAARHAGGRDPHRRPGPAPDGAAVAPGVRRVRTVGRARVVAAGRACRSTGRGFAQRRVGWTTAADPPPWRSGSATAWALPSGSSSIAATTPIEEVSPSSWPRCASWSP